MKQFLNICKNILLVGVILTLVACGLSKLNPENISKVEEGMKEEEVIAILGQPKEQSSSGMLGISGTTYLYDDGKTEVQVVFLNGKVISKASHSKK